MTHRNKKGFTLVELIVGTAFTIVLLLGFSQNYGYFQQLFLQNRIRSTMNQEVRSFIDTLQVELKTVSPTTIQITTPTGAPPYSMLMYTRADGRRVRYQMIAAAGTPETLFIREVETAPGLNVYDQRILSRLVRYVFFTGSAIDQGWISVSINLTKPLGGERAEVLFLPNQIIRIGNYT